MRRVPLDSIREDPANARLHPERNLAAIRSSLARFGQAEPLVVQLKTMRLIAGHGRLAAMRALGWTEVDVVEVDLSPTESTALATALNRSAELAEWDKRALASLLEQLQEEDCFAGLGFVQQDLDALLGELAMEDDPLAGLIQDEVPGLPDAATTRAGDLWILGRHRLMCGDSTSSEAMDKLLGGASIHLVNMDVPYNVKVEPRSNNAIAAGNSSFTNAKKKAHKSDGLLNNQHFDQARFGKRPATHAKLRAKDRPLQNDFVDDQEFARLLRGWFGNASRALEPGRGFYFWGGYANLANFPSAIAESGLYFSQAIVWNKLHPVLTRKDFMGAFELAFYGWKEGAAHQFLGPNNASDLWEVKKMHHTSMVHLTEKPVELAARAIQYSSRKGERVFDGCGGSGSTLIACEQTNRQAFIMEIDALYCDVIVERWQQLTGQRAILEGTTRPYAALRKERTADVQ